MTLTGSSGSTCQDDRLIAIVSCMFIAWLDPLQDRRQLSLSSFLSVLCRQPFSFTLLTNNEGILAWEAILRNLEVQRGRTLSYTAGDVVVRTVAGTEPAAKVTGFADRDTTEMGAHA